MFFLLLICKKFKPVSICKKPTLYDWTTCRYHLETFRCENQIYIKKYHCVNKPCEYVLSFYFRTSQNAPLFILCKFQIASSFLLFFEQTKFAQRVTTPLYKQNLFEILWINVNFSKPMNSFRLSCKLTIHTNFKVLNQLSKQPFQIIKKRPFCSRWSSKLKMTSKMKFEK